MTAHGSGPRPARPGPDRRAAEKLLRRDPSAHARTPQLAALLNAAAAPGRPEELAGQSAAVAAFRDGRRHAAAIPGHRRRSARSRLARLLTLKAAIGMAVATGSVALAAATGALPGTPRLADPLPGTHAPATTPSPSEEKTNARRTTPPGAAPTSPQKSCEDEAAGSTGGETTKPPADRPTGRPEQQPRMEPYTKPVSCVRSSPAASPSVFPTPTSSFPPPGGMPAGGWPPPDGGSGECREACPPPANGGGPRP